MLDNTHTTFRERWYSACHIVPQSQQQWPWIIALMQLSMILAARFTENMRIAHYKLVNAIPDQSHLEAAP